MKVYRTKTKLCRRGFSRMDMFVCLGLAMLVFALISPAINQRPRAARVLECLNNMRNVGLAIQNFESGSAGQLPALSRLQKIKTDAGSEGTLAMSWPIDLLPALDSTAVLKKIKRNAVAKADPLTGATMIVSDEEKIWLPVFTCPNDSDSFRKPAGLSFVINAGFMHHNVFHGDPQGLHSLESLSWDGNDIPGEDQDIRVSAATGVVWRENKTYQSSLASISAGDGTSTTILLAENLQSGFWYDTNTACIGFGIPIDAKDNQVRFGDVL